MLRHQMRTAEAVVRRMTWAAIAVAMALGSGTPAAAFNQTGYDLGLLPESRPPYMEIDALQAGLGNTFRTVVRVGRAEGLSQIYDQVGRSSLEEQWAYLPALGLWIEIGHNERTTEADAEVEIDLPYLRAIVARYPDVHLVHFHPASFYPVVLPASAPAAAIADDVAAIGYALPSPTDVASSIRLMEVLRADNPAVRVELSVVSPHGVVTYGVTEPGLRTIAYEGNNPRAGTARSIVTRLAIRRMPFNIAKTVDALGTASIAEVIAAFCAQASDENYTLVYSPLVPATDPPATLPVAARSWDEVRDLLIE